MLQGHDDDDKYLDCHAVCQIAKVLLELDSAPKPMTTHCREARDFASTPLGVSVDELLQVRSFLNRWSQSANDMEAPIPSWCC
jgi:hypothetical protein